MHSRLYQGGQKKRFWADITTPTNGHLWLAAVLVMILRSFAMVGGIWLVILPGVTIIGGAKPTRSLAKRSKRR